MIPDWLDFRSAAFGAAVAYSIPILFAVALCWLCDLADRREHKQRDREERRRIDLHVTQKQAEINADRIIAWADVAPHTDVVKNRFHRVTNVDG